MLRLTLSPTARADLRAVYHQGLEAFGEARADAYIDGLLAVLDLLVEFPGLGRLRDELPAPAHIYRYRSHVIVYDLDESGDLHVVRIRHGREDWLSNPTAGSEMGDEP